MRGWNCLCGTWRAASSRAHDGYRAGSRDAPGEEGHAARRSLKSGQGPSRLLRPGEGKEVRLPPQRADIPLRSERCRLVVLAVEAGGRWSDEAASFVRALARAKAREVPVCFRSSLVACCPLVCTPPLGELFADAGGAPLAASRLPAG